MGSHGKGGSAGINLIFAVVVARLGRLGGGYQLYIHCGCVVVGPLGSRTGGIRRDINLIFVVDVARWYRLEGSWPKPLLTFSGQIVSEATCPEERDPGRSTNEFNKNIRCLQSLRHFKFELSCPRPGVGREWPLPRLTVKQISTISGGLWGAHGRLSGPSKESRSPRGLDQHIARKQKCYFPCNHPAVFHFKLMS